MFFISIYLLGFLFTQPINFLGTRGQGHQALMKSFCPRMWLHQSPLSCIIFQLLAI